jgi:hypothetical protein
MMFIYQHVTGVINSRVPEAGKHHHTSIRLNFGLGDGAPFAIEEKCIWVSGARTGSTFHAEMDEGYLHDHHLAS